MVDQVLSLMDINQPGFFIHIAGLASANFMFEIPSPHARGRRETLQVSLVGEGAFTPQLESLLATFVDKFRAIPEVECGLDEEAPYFAAPVRAQVHALFDTFHEFVQPSLEALREAELRYQALFKSARDAIMIFDYHTARVVDVNAHAEILLGRARDALVGSHPREFNFTEDFTRLRDQVLAHVQADARPFEIDIHARPGPPMPVEVNASALEVGERKLVFAVFRDITERKRTERALRRSEETARALLDATTDAVFLLSRDGTVLSINHPATSLVEEAPETLAGQSFYELFRYGEAAKARKFVEWVTRSKRPVHGEHAFRRRQYQISAYPVFSAEGEVERVAYFLKSR